MEKKSRLAVYSLQRVKEVGGLYTVNKSMSNPGNVVKVLEEVLDIYAIPHEIFVVLSVDAKNNLVGINVPFKGSLSTSIVHPREIFQAALLNNASAIILAHNHPSGDPAPSKEDKMITQRLVEAGRILGIEVLDHVIVGNTYYSLAGRGLI